MLEVLDVGKFWTLASFGRWKVLDVEDFLMLGFLDVGGFGRRKVLDVEKFWTLESFGRWKVLDVEGFLMFGFFDVGGFGRWGFWVLVVRDV